MNEILPKILPFLPVLPFIVIGGVFYFSYKRSRQKVPMEMGFMPILEETCGGRFGFTNFSYPFVQLRIYEDFLVISYWKRIVLHFYEITNIEMKNYFPGRTPFKSLKIEHNRLDYPQRIWLQVRNAEQILEILRSKQKEKKYS